jgi:tol-pal system protein YbgF
MKHGILIAGISLTLAGVLLAGCGTTGGKQVETTIYDMHRRVVKLDKSLEDSVTKLNETTAELIARVNESDQQTRQLKTISEENQVKLDSLSRDLNELKTTLYRQLNLSVGSGGGISSRGMGLEGGEATGNVEILPPAPSNVLTTPPRVTTVPGTAAPAEAAPPVTPVGGGATAAPVGTMTGGDPRAEYQQAQKSYANEDYELALRQFTEHLQKYPNDETAENAQFWKAKCYLSLNKFQEAIQEFEKMHSGYPSSTKVPFAMHNEAVAYSRLGQVDKAEKLLQEVIDKYPVSPAADQAKSDLKKLKGQ